jgi:hypothetical protein
MIVLEEIDAPDRGGIAGGGTAQAAHRQIRNASPLEGITAAHLHGGRHRLGVAGMALMDAVNAAIQQLAQYPAIGAGVGLIQPDDADLHKHRRCAMAGARRTAIHQAAHEFAQLGEIQRAMFHFHIDGVVPGARHLHALGVGIHARSKAGAVVIDRLVVFPQLDRLVDAAGFVIMVHRRRLDILAHHLALIDVDRRLEIGTSSLGFGLAGCGRHSRGGADAGSQAEKIAFLDIHAPLRCFVVGTTLHPADRSGKSLKYLRKCKRSAIALVREMTARIGLTLAATLRYDITGSLDFRGARKRSPIRNPARRPASAGRTPPPASGAQYYPARH